MRAQGPRDIHRLKYRGPQAQQVKRTQGPHRYTGSGMEGLRPLKKKLKYKMLKVPQIQKLK